MADDCEHSSRVPDTFARLLLAIRDVDAHLDANTSAEYRDQELAGHP